MCCDCRCGCTSSHHEGHGRRFLTKTEKIEKLKNYEQELTKELEAVQEQIKELSD
jgi:hypothetical protein